MSEYTLYLGDCLEYMKSMLDKSVDAVITDPPYGMDLDTDYSGIDNGIIHAPIIGDDKRFDPLPFLSIAQKHIIWGAQYFCHSLPESGGWLVFNKRGYGATSEICFGDCELAWCDVMQSVRIYNEQWHGYPRTRAGGGGFHPSQKPIGLMKWCIELASKKDDIIFDPFMGSGTTGVACMQLGRKFIGCEIDPSYFAIAEKRIKQAAAQMLLPL